LSSGSDRKSQRRADVQMNTLALINGIVTGAAGIAALPIGM